MRKIVCAVVVALVVAVAVLAGPTGPATAGGSNWVFEREHFRPGDTVFVWAQIAWEHNPALGTPDEGPYHAFVVPHSPGGASVGDRAEVPVGDVTISLEPYDAGTVRFGPHHAELVFTVPNLPPGQYDLLHANDAGKQVGDLSGSGLFWIDPPLVYAQPTFTG